MPKNVKCKNCNNLKDDWCEKVTDSPHPDIVRDCRHFSLKTNADVIRAMSNDELVVFIDALTAECLECAARDGHNHNCEIQKAGERFCSPASIKEWLEKEKNNE